MKEGPVTQERTEHYIFNGETNLRNKSHRRGITGRTSTIPLPMYLESSGVNDGLPSSV